MGDKSSILNHPFGEKEAHLNTWPTGPEGNYVHNRPAPQDGFWSNHEGERLRHRAYHAYNREHHVGSGIYHNRNLSNDLITRTDIWPSGEQRMRNAENDISSLESRYTRNIYGQDGLRRYAMNHENRISNLEDALA